MWNLKIILLIIFLILVLMFTTSEEKDLCPIVINAVFSTEDLNGKGSYFNNAISLFTKHNDCFVANVADSQSDQAIVHTTFDRWFSKPVRGNQILLGPESSHYIPTMLEAVIPYRDNNEKQEVPLWSMVTASELFLETNFSKAVFPLSTQYLAGLDDLLTTEFPILTSNSYSIVLFDETTYLRELYNSLQQNWQDKTVESFDVVGVDNAFLNLADELATAKSDVLILVGYDHKKLLPVAATDWYQAALKVFIGGSLENKEDVLYKNSLQTLWYAPGLQLNGQDKNCWFTNEYLSEFSSEPDYHAAYLFATFEAAAATIKDPSTTTVATLLGDVAWDESGRNIYAAPHYLYTETDGTQTLFSRSITGICPSNQTFGVQIRRY